MSKYDYVQRPPLGLTPIKMWHEMRKRDIEEAIVRFILADKPIPNEWINELQTIYSILQPEPEERNWFEKNKIKQEHVGRANLLWYLQRAHSFFQTGNGYSEDDRIKFGAELKVIITKEEEFFKTPL